MTTWTVKNPMLPGPNTAPASWAITVFWTYPAGAPVSWAASAATCTCVASARVAIPISMATVIPPMIARVAAALWLLGSLKLGTPLLTASTPVRAVHPDANERSTIARRSSGPSSAGAWMPMLADSATGG